MTASPFVPMVAFTIALVATATDLSARRIPNALTFGGALLALIFHAAVDGLGGAGTAAAGWAIGAAIFFPVFALGGMGAGDVKLVAALGAWLGPLGAIHVAVGSALVGGVIGVLVSLRAGYLATAIHNIRLLLMHWQVHGLTPKPDLTLGGGSTPRLAYALPILFGTLGALWLR